MSVSAGYLDHPPADHVPGDLPSACRFDRP
jgi:hypothetical protein